MTRLEILYSVLRVPLDFIACFLAAIFAYSIRPYTNTFLFWDLPFDKAYLIPFDYFLAFSFFTSLGFIILSALNGLYNFISSQGRFWEFFRISLSVIFLVLAIIAYYALFEVGTFFSRGVLLFLASFTLIFSFSFRMILRQIERYVLSQGIGIRKIALFGEEHMRDIIKKEIQKLLHYKVIFDAPRFVDGQVDPSTLNEVWFIKTENNNDGRELLEFAQVNHLLYRFIPDVFGTLHAKVEEGTIGIFPLLTVKATPLEGWGRVLKRAFDILFSSLTLIFLLPFFLIISILIKLDSKGPVFYVSERVGRNGKLFPMLKFRSMIVNADELKARLEEMNHRKDTPLFKIKNDPRVTPFGRFLRRFSIDELPQFINVFIGNMSVVGPRAHLANEVEKYSLDQRRVLMIKPGISGLPQISGRSDLNFDEEIRLDLHYIVHWSLLLDLKIIWKTPFVLLGGKGAD